MSVEILTLAMRARLPSPAHKLALIFLANQAACDGWQSIEGRLDPERLAVDVGIDRSRLDAVLQSLCAIGAVSIAPTATERTYWLDAGRLEALGLPEVTT